MTIVAHFVKIRLALAMLVWQTAVCASQQLAGSSITGYVHLPDGSPAAQFTVLAASVTNKSGPAYRNRTFTADDGQFSLTSLPSGDYAVSSFREGDPGYPLPGFRFYQIKPLFLSLTKDEVRRLQITLLPPLAKMAGVVSDKATGKGIQSTITLYLANDPKGDLRFSADPSGYYQASIPRDTTIIMQVAAPGYEAVQRNIIYPADDKSNVITTNISLTKLPISHP